jgi:ATP-dependent RNA helicase DDX56/DBP9
VPSPTLPLFTLLSYDVHTGYINDVEQIIKSIPRVCQGLLMSATLSPELNSLKKIVLHSPVVLKLETEEQSSSKGRLSQFYLTLPRRDKNLVIYTFLKLGILKGKGIFFVNSTDGGYKLKLFLEQFSIRSTVLNAELPFRSRVNIIEQFNVGNLDYIIASDESADVPGGDGDDNDDDRDGSSDEENDDDDDEGEGKDDDQKQSRSGRKGDTEYGVSRGLDFRGASFVLNVDFPPSKWSYTHRIGRTARGGANGVALSLVEQDSQSQLEVLQEVQNDQPRISGTNTAPAQSSLSQLGQSTADSPSESFQPSPLDFDLREIEGFRYRVEDVARAVTKSAVKEARVSELRAEVLNSDRLHSYFEENPTDLQLLRHDRYASNAAKIQEHLK